jgi:hypothetical protein
MINLMKYAPLKQKEFEILAGSSFGEEGMAAIQVQSGGKPYLKPSTGTAGDMFVGVTNSDNEDIASKAVMEVLTVPAAPGPYTLQLAKTGLLGSGATVQCSVWRNDTGAKLTQVAAAINVDAATKFDIAEATGVLTLHSGLAEVEITVQYRYATTVAEVKQTDWQRGPNNVAGDDLARIGVGMGGYIETNMFDATQDYQPADGDPPVEVTTGANGLFSSDVAGLAINAVGFVEKPPSTDNPMIGIRFYDVPRVL